MTKQRTLADLYVRGTDLAFDDGSNDPLVVWVQKLNPVEHSLAVRKADAARARTLTIKFDTECEEYQALLNDILGAERGTLIEILSAAEEARILPVREANMADDDKWKEDNYLQGLRDAWRDSAMDAFIKDPEDAEAKRIHDELERFVKTVHDDVAGEIESYRHSLATMSEKELVTMSMEHRIKAAADMAWVNEYYRSEIAFGTRDVMNHKQKYFAGRDDIDELQILTYSQLAQAFRDLTVEPVEGKDLAGSPPSSDSSEPSDKEVTEPSSGQTE